MEKESRGVFGEERRRALFSYFVLVRLGHRGVHVLANEDEKLAFFSESRPRVPALVPRSGKVFGNESSPGRGIGPIREYVSLWFVPLRDWRLRRAVRLSPASEVSIQRRNS